MDYNSQLSLNPIEQEEVKNTKRLQTLFINGPKVECVVFFKYLVRSYKANIHIEVQIPTLIPEKIVVALFSGIRVNSGIQVEAVKL